jgi:hypothetical protein
MRVAVLAIVFATVTVSCTTRRAADDDDGSGTSSGCIDGAGEPTPMLETDVAPIFASNCVQASHCHSQQNYFPTTDNDCRGGLALEDLPLGSAECAERSLRERLVGPSAEQCIKTTALLVPCDAQASYFFRKIAGGPYCDGEAMPLDASLPPEEIEIIRRWIDGGAPSLNVAAAECPPASGCP